MQCPKCKSENIQVIDSRDFDVRTIKRRRECCDCKYRFTSYEKVELLKVMVEKRSGNIEPFDREKITKGIRLSGSDKISEEQIFDIADEIEQKVIETGEDTIPSRKIGNMVICRLKKIDKIAYLRFASVYKNFEDIDSFEQELIKLKKTNSNS